MLAFDGFGKLFVGWKQSQDVQMDEVWVVAIKVPLLATPRDEVLWLSNRDLDGLCDDFDGSKSMKYFHRPQTCSFLLLTLPAPLLIGS